MAKMFFGGVEENVVTREEYPLAKALETLKDETIAVIGYGVQGPGQSLNLRDNGFNVIVGQRKGSKSWDKAVEDGWPAGTIGNTFSSFSTLTSKRKAPSVSCICFTASAKSSWRSTQR